VYLIVGIIKVMSHANLQHQSFLWSHCRGLSFVHTNQRHGRDRM